MYFMWLGLRWRLWHKAERMNRANRFRRKVIFTAENADMLRMHRISRKLPRHMNLGTWRWFSPFFSFAVCSLVCFRLAANSNEFCNLKKSSFFPRDTQLVLNSIFFVPLRSKPNFKNVSIQSRQWNVHKLQSVSLSAFQRGRMNVAVSWQCAQQFGIRCANFPFWRCNDELSNATHYVEHLPQMFIRAEYITWLSFLIPHHPRTIRIIEMGQVI